MFVYVFNRLQITVGFLIVFKLIKRVRSVFINVDYKLLYRLLYNFGVMEKKDVHPISVANDESLNKRNPPLSELEDKKKIRKRMLDAKRSRAYRIRKKMIKNLSKPDDSDDEKSAQKRISNAKSCRSYRIRKNMIKNLSKPKVSEEEKSAQKRKSNAQYCRTYRIRKKMMKKSSNPNNGLEMQNKTEKRKFNVDRCRAYRNRMKSSETATTCGTSTFALPLWALEVTKRPETTIRNTNVEVANEDSNMISIANTKKPLTTCQNKWPESDTGSESDSLSATTSGTSALPLWALEVTKRSETTIRNTNVEASNEASNMVSIVSQKATIPKPLIKKPLTTCQNKWRESDTFKFVELYEQAECLWNYKHPAYKIRTLREKASQHIIDQMNKPEFGLAELKNKIKNIRSTYMQEINKIKRSKLSLGSDVIEEYKTNLAWFPIADRFLSKVINSCRTPAKKEILDDSINELNNDTTLFNMEPVSFSHFDNEIEEKYSPYTVNMDDIKQEIDIEYSEMNLSHEMNQPEAKVETIFQRVKKRKGSAEISQEPVVELDGMQDEWYHFGHNVACQLRNLPLVRALECQQKILQVLMQERINHVESVHNE